MTDRIFAQVDRGFTTSEDVDPVEESAREELAPRATFGLAPRLWELPDVADRDVGGDSVQWLASLGRRLFPVELSHPLFKERSVAISKLTDHGAVALARDPNRDSSDPEVMPLGLPRR